MKNSSIIHTFKPIYDKESKILILGSFPSVKSRETGFYYGHPQNRFWKLLAMLFDDNLPSTNEEKEEFLLRHRIALYDAAYSCNIEGSSDASMKNIKLNDFSLIFKETSIRAVFCNGKKSYELTKKNISVTQRKVPVIPLPSTSPANAICSLEDLRNAWQIIVDTIESLEYETV